MADAHANFAVSTVATAPSPATSGTSLSVASGEGARFPAVPFNATVRPANAPPDPSNAEIIRVTARTTDALTATRAQEGSSARSIQVGDHISATVTAKSLTDIEVVDAAAGTGSLRTIGKTALKAADGADTEFAFSGWKDHGRTHGQASFAAGVVAGTYMFRPNLADIVGAANSAQNAIYLDPADYPGGTRTTKFRVRGWVITNAVAPAINFTFGLYPITTFAGASGSIPTVTALGSATATSSTVTAPGATTQTVVTTSATTFPAAGWYVVAVVLSGTTAANSSTLCGAELQVQQV